MSFKCYLCNCDSFSVVAKKQDIRFNCYDSEKQIVKCNQCSLVQLHPVWTPEELDKIYNGWNQQKDFPGQKIISKRINTYLANYLKNFHYLLEIGCGNGDNVKYLHELGHRVIGIDKDKSVCNNKDIFNFGYEDFLNSNKKFDAIYAIHLFEHLTNPEDFLKKCFNSIDIGGRLLIEIPNTDEPLLSLYDNKFFFKYYWRPEHIFFYTPNTIKQLMKKVGISSYKIVLRQNYGLQNHLNWLIRRKPTNFNIKLPILDNIYKWFLTKILGISDTIILIINKEK